MTNAKMLDGMKAWRQRLRSSSDDMPILDHAIALLEKMPLTVTQDGVTYEMTGENRRLKRGDYYYDKRGKVSATIHYADSDCSDTAAPWLIYRRIDFSPTPLEILQSKLDELTHECVKLHNEIDGMKGGGKASKKK